MISAQRLTEQLATLSNISAPGEGINRLAFTDSDWQGRSYLMKLMKDAGLTLRVDAFGNVIGHYAGRNDSLPAIMFGSHGDSVPEGGNYDGIVGILSAIETVRSMQEDGYQPEQPLEVVLFMCEESSRFGAATLGSRAMRGELSSEDLHRLKDREGHTLWQVLESRDLHPESIASAQYTKPLKAFMEVHIEQGRVLESAQKQVGIVTGIAAPTRLLCHLHGRADHSGATPMNLRQDGLCAGAEIILAVEQAAKNCTAAPVVGTVVSLRQPRRMSLVKLKYRSKPSQTGAAFPMTSNPSAMNVQPLCTPAWSSCWLTLLVNWDSIIWKCPAVLAMTACTGPATLPRACSLSPAAQASATIQRSTLNSLISSTLPRSSAPPSAGLPSAAQHSKEDIKLDRRQLD